MADDVERKDSLQSLLEVRRNVAAARKEINNLRKEVQSIRKMFVAKFTKIEEILNQGYGREASHQTTRGPDASGKLQYCGEPSNLLESSYSPVGYLESCFKEKNGIPRQPSVCPAAKARLRVTVSNFTNPEHSLEGLEQFSHVWLLFIFHKNTNKTIKAKVKPPRLNGGKVGVFASRSPHRPNPIGLTLAKLDGIHGNTLYLSGIDILDGTPVVDVKPYIPAYDKPVAMDTQVCMERDFAKECVAMATDFQNAPLRIDHCPDGKEMQSTDKESPISVAGWVTKPPVRELAVHFQEMAETQLSMFHGERDVRKEDSCECKTTFSSLKSMDGEEYGAVNVCTKRNLYGSDSFKDTDNVEDNQGLTRPEGRSFVSEKHEQVSCRRQSSEECIYQLAMFSSVHEARQSIIDVLRADPRSVYRRNQCANELYHFSIDKLNVACRFDVQRVDVVTIEPTAFRRGKEMDADL